MSRTEADAAAAFYADALLPLKQANARRGRAYFATRPDPALATYWAAPATRSGGTDRLAFGETGGAAMLDLLEAFWFAQNEPALPMLKDELEALRQTLTQAASEQAGPHGQLSFSAYPLF